MDIVVGTASPYTAAGNTNCATGVSSDGSHACIATAITWLFCVRTTSGTTNMDIRDVQIWSKVDHGPTFSQITSKTGSVSGPVNNLVGNTPITQTLETLTFPNSPNVLFFEFPIVFTLEYLVAVNFGSTDVTSTYDIFYG